MPKRSGLGANQVRRVKSADFGPPSQKSLWVWARIVVLLEAPAGTDCSACDEMYEHHETSRRVFCVLSDSGTQHEPVIGWEFCRFHRALTLLRRERTI